MPIDPLKRVRPLVVKVVLSLTPGATAADAEVDEADVGTDNWFDVVACSHEEAKEKALDEYHESVAIGMLDYIETTVTVYEKEDDPR